jgi:CheY-like chemotaxis protein
MLRFRSPAPAAPSRRSLDLARVLLAHGELAPRLALQTILRAGGYAVDVAATPAEAITKLDEGVYELVLSDDHFGERRAGQEVLAYARVKTYRPATALVTSYDKQPSRKTSPKRHEMAVYTEDLPLLLGKVAELIGIRASRRYRPLSRAV